MQGMISDPELAIRFMLAGNATVTLKSQKTGNHYTYRIKPFPGCNDPKHYRVFLLTGPDNKKDYSWLGRIVNGQFYLTRKSREMGLSENTSSVKAIIWVLINLGHHNKMPAWLEIWHEGRCGHCGRPLTVPESIESGIGPVCAEQMVKDS